MTTTIAEVTLGTAAEPARVELAPAEVIVGVDTHKDTHHLAVFHPARRRHRHRGGLPGRPCDGWHDVIKF
ncbi:hypothetical protein [Nesterenkonia muleiensis]|uniref:hypothetical protein n=1 Tax=Nesterenkonia muleiensis TaxID=2282648 RepID=UPI001300BD1E|nr:hypothetical protein [Nesterenkonia muleiensis]